MHQVRSLTPVMMTKPAPKFRQDDAPIEPKPRLTADWRGVLEAIKYPTTVLVLDFESYFDSEYGLKNLSTIEYVVDKRWEVLGLAMTVMHEGAPPDAYERMHDGEEMLARLQVLPKLQGNETGGSLRVQRKCEDSLPRVCLSGLPDSPAICPSSEENVGQRASVQSKEIWDDAGAIPKYAGSPRRLVPNLSATLKTAGWQGSDLSSSSGPRSSNGESAGSAVRKLQQYGQQTGVTTSEGRDQLLGTTFFRGEGGVASALRQLQRIFGTDFEHCVISHQNAKFDALVLLKHYNITPKYLIDTVDLARAWNSRQNHGLADLAKQWELPDKGDTMEFSGVTNRVRYKSMASRKRGPKMPQQIPLATPEQLQALADYAKNDAELQWQIFTILLPRLSNPAFEIRLMRHTLDVYLHPSLTVDYAKGQELLGVFQKELDTLIAATGHTREEISGDKSFEAIMLRALQAAGDDISKYLKQMKRGPMLAIAKTDDAREALATHYDPTVRALLAARSGIDSWPNHIGRVQRIMAQCKANGDMLGVPLRYHGAHTGRFSGG